MSLQADLDGVRRTARQGIEQLSTIVFDRSGNWLGWYLLLLLVAVFAYQIAFPIVMLDTDMWYHLSGGRLLWAEGDLPDHPYFSFAFPDREWIAYFWGFQAMIYPIFETFGYQGLIIARAVLFTLGFGMVIAFLHRSNNRSSTWAVVAVAVVYLLIFETRSLQLRPHLISYAMIPLFAYILEHRRAWLPALPLLTLIWANLHGVEWVIGATIAGAYFIEWSIAWFTGAADKPRTSSFLWLCACLPALLINPFGWEIIKAPFAIPEGLGRYIIELQPPALADFFSLDTQALTLGRKTLLSALMLLTIAAAIRCLLYGRFRASHMIMALAGLVLLTRGQRFAYEWALLSLPLIASSLERLRLKHLEQGTSAIPILLAAALLLVPLHSLVTHVPDNRAKYPLNDEGLPVGITTFLTNQEARGNLLIPPAWGGYINWALYPDVLIHSDMQFPPFDATATLELTYATSGNEDAIRSLTTRYPVDFIAINVDKTFGGMLDETFGYKAVFFDDAFVLYAHEERQKDLVEANRFEFIDPHSLVNGAGTVDEQLGELERVRSQWPSGRRVNHATTYMLLDAQRYAEAEIAAERFVRYYPEDPNSHYLSGNIFQQQNQFEAAIDKYRDAMAYSDAVFERTLFRNIGACHYLDQNFVEAYSAFARGVDLAVLEEEPETLYQYAYSAIIAGDISGARRLLEGILFLTPASKQDTLDDARALIARIDEGGLVSAGPLGFLGSLFGSDGDETTPR